MVLTWLLQFTTWKNLLDENIYTLETMQYFTQDLMRKGEGVVHGEKQGFRLLCKHDKEVLFGEAKPQTTENCNVVANQACAGYWNP
nr:9471_t:CDS:2 [Entrophospora candida]